MLEQLKLLREAIKQAKQDLNENELVQQVKLMQLAWDLLNGDVSLSDFFGEAFEWPTNDAEKEEKLVELLKKLFEIGIALEDDEATKELLEKAFERACEGTEALKGFLESDDNWKFLKEWFGEKLKEKLQSLLAKKLGAKAAGSIISILNDLIALKDAIDKRDKILELLQKWDTLMINLLEKLKEMGLGTEPGKELKEGSVTYPSEFNGGVGKVTPVMWCYYPGQKPGKGRWKDKTLKFKDGSTTKTYDLPDDGKSHTFDTPNLEVPSIPNGAQICYITFRIEAWKKGSNSNKPPPDGSTEVILRVVCP